MILRSLYLNQIYLYFTEKRRTQHHSSGSAKRRLSTLRCPQVCSKLKKKTGKKEKKKLTKEDIGTPMTSGDFY